MKKVRMTLSNIILMQSTLEATFRVLEIAPAVRARRNTHKLYWIHFTIQEPSGEDSEHRQTRIQGEVALKSLIDPNVYSQFGVEGVRHDLADYYGNVKGWHASGRLDVGFYIPNTDKKPVCREFHVDGFGQLVN